MLCLWLYCISITKKSDVYHIGLSRYVSEYCISISKKSDRSITVIYHAIVSDYCISITKKSDMSITVIYHAMSLTVLYQYHEEEWYIYHSDLSRYVWLLYQYN